MIFNLNIIGFSQCSLFSLSKINKVKYGGTQDLFKFGLIIMTIVITNTFLYFLQAFIVQITRRKRVKKTKYTHFLFIFYILSYSYDWFIIMYNNHGCMFGKVQ